MSVTGFESDQIDRIDEEDMKERIRFNLGRFEKFNYRVVMRFGDLYYQKMS
jgi:hypothetical protein